MAVRYIGLDIHKQQVTVAGVDAQQQEIIAPLKLSTARFFQWVETHLAETDVIALEVSSNAWDFYDRLVPQVAEIQVANPYKIKLITSSHKKTDQHDARVLAKLAAANLLPSVWVPPTHVRDLRSLTAHRDGLIRARTMAKNQLHSILHRHNLSLPSGDPFCAEQSRWWDELKLPSVERLQIHHEKRRIQQLNEMIGETELELAHLSTSEPWLQPVTLLLQIPGIGMTSAMTILGAIGDIQRFPSARQLVGYAGLGARVRASGDTRKTGAMSKAGRKELRKTLVECAWMAVRWSAYWKNRYRTLTKRMPKAKAITVIAHKLLVNIWHILTKQEVDRFADFQAIARSLMNWATGYGLAAWLGIRRIDLVRQQLERLGIRDQIDQMHFGGRIYPIAVARS